jgi:hypothetical protein
LQQRLVGSGKQSINGGKGILNRRIGRHAIGLLPLALFRCLQGRGLPPVQKLVAAPTTQQIICLPV